MPAFRINDAELDALMGEGADLFQLYVGALRPRMDFKTGVVGRRVRISYQALKEWTERAARSGVRFLAHDKSKLQRMLARLQHLGLLRKMGGPYDLVFACPLADTDNCAQKQADTKSIHPEKPTKPRRSKASRDLPTASENAEAATHQESGNTLKPPPPTPSGLRPEEDGSIDPPAPAAQEAGNPKIDETPINARSQQPSEERLERPTRGGGRPAAERLDEGAKPSVTWEPHLAWPTGITPHQRAYIARRLVEVPESLRQRVLDEWHGATQAGAAKKPWPYFNGLLRNVKERGDAWTSIHAEGVAEAREQERRRLANLAAVEAAHAERLQGEAVSPGGLLQWKRELDATRERRRQA
ncbi:hypothetical protein CNE_1c11820 [Cupriavidus necator N-1]|uniref:Uncharacterized protein n=1 Tax=Cupriavidus necator (strain ATCC 43291 / DSM 13513 / CCUG 52238 / LMG 8453 / N-1) TaxID=1042878 RepID=G0ER19_CUPNN|nr:hypothetical protein [Cupriavidus necator]AEI76537.1 hypothetical protein CNE_1c11820 [Cupriavidus necator N-1]MDX6011342.1 hypothetical protein [Cupriavidus necator]